MPSGARVCARLPAPPSPAPSVSVFVLKTDSKSLIGHSLPRSPRPPRGLGTVPPPQAEYRGRRRRQPAQPPGLDRLAALLADRQAVGDPRRGIAGRVRRRLDPLGTADSILVRPSSWRLSGGKTWARFKVAALAGDNSWGWGRGGNSRRAPARRPRIWGRRPPGVDPDTLSCNPLLNHARIRGKNWTLLRRRPLVE